MLHGAAETAVQRGVFRAEDTNDRECGDQHNNTLHHSNLGHGLYAAGHGIDNGDDNGQYQANVIGVGAGNGSKYLCAGGDLAGGEEDQTKGAGQRQSGDNLAGLEAQTQQLQEGDGTGAVTQDSNLATNRAKAIGCGQETAIVDKSSCKTDCVA